MTEHTVILGDAFDIVPTIAPLPHVFTSVPDAAETTLSIPDWETFYRRCITLICTHLDPAGYAIFYATDRRHDGILADKGGMIAAEALAAGARVVWHKIAVRTMGTSLFRPSFSHLIAVSHTGTAGTPTPDVFEAGRKQYANATDATSLGVGFAFLLASGSTFVADPFCGRGSHARAAEVVGGISTVNIDINPSQTAAARRLIDTGRP